MAVVVTAPYLVCPTCEHVESRDQAGGRAEAAGDTAGGPPEAGDEAAGATAPAGPACPACGSGRAYHTPEPALPDAESEAYVKLDADDIEDG